MRHMESILFAATLFMAVSAGPFGIEKALQMLPITHVVYIFLVAHVFFLVPTAVMTVEMIERRKNAKAEGGAISWVEEAFGRRMGIIHGVILIIALTVDSATYPHLLAESIGVENSVFLIAVPIIISATVGMMGFAYTGAYALLNACVVLSPFVGLFVITPWRDMYTTGHYVPQNKIEYTFLARECLIVILWNVTGFNMIATYAHNVRKDTIAVIAAQCVVFVTGMYIMSLCQASYYIHEKSEWTWEDVGHLSMREVGRAWMSVATVASTLGALSIEIYAISNLWAGLVKLRIAPRAILTNGVGVIVTCIFTALISGMFQLEQIVDMSVMLNSTVFIIQAVAWCDIMGKGILAWRMVMTLGIILISLSTIACNTFWCIYSLLAVFVAGGVVGLFAEIHMCILRRRTSL